MEIRSELKIQSSFLFFHTDVLYARSKKNTLDNIIPVGQGVFFLRKSI